MVATDHIQVSVKPLYIISGVQATLVMLEGVESFKDNECSDKKIMKQTLLPVIKSRFVFQQNPRKILNDGIFFGSFFLSNQRF